MATGSNDTSRLLDVEPNEEIVNEVHPQQTFAPPPSYQMVTGLPTFPNQSVSGQTSVGNYHTPGFSQPPPTMYYGYTDLQQANGQPTFSGGISTLPTGQPIYLIPATALPANYGQPLTINQYRTSQPRLTGIQPRNMRTHRRIAEPNSDADVCLKCCVGVFVIVIMACVIFSFALINMNLKAA